VTATTAAGLAVTSVYQPIVELDTGEVLAYEALARGPAGTALESPDAMFAAAAADGWLEDLDWNCRVAAVTGAAGAVGRRRTLFVNVEPATLGSACPAPLRERWEQGVQELDLVIEVTERALTARPAMLLNALEVMRARGWGVALDDVGADARSLALMPLLRPDVIKLDLRLVQQRPDSEIAGIVAAVNAEWERSGALVLAEGIETPAHLRAALGMGAVLGQGWLFGRPGPLPDNPRLGGRGRSLRLPRHARLNGLSPFEVVREVRDIRIGDKDLLLAITRQLEEWVPTLGTAAVLLSAFQTAERFTPTTRRRYEGFARHASLVAALGVGIAPEPAPGVRGAALEPDDTLRDEWSVVVVGPHQAGALVARDLGDTGMDRERRFEFALTYDRDLVVDAANALLSRVQPA
jgi:EAL domain-containing protein (putative c-di-GMP-specific phosphodiesterase class I)